VLGWVYVVRSEVHQVVPNLDYFVEAFDEVLLVDVPRELGPVLVGSQQVAVVAKREVRCLGHGVTPVLLHGIPEFGQRVDLVGPQTQADLGNNADQPDLRGTQASMK